MMRILARYLKSLIKRGTLTVVEASGKEHVFSGAPGPAVTMRFSSRILPLRLAIHPGLYLGEAYADGTLTVENGSIYDLLDLLTMNLGPTLPGSFAKAVSKTGLWLRFLEQFNPIYRARHNAAFHYDLPDELYDLFLDNDRQYSCAYFREPGESLEQAQENKKAHIAAKLCLDPGQSVLDIGCGWGGLARYLANNCDADVTGITLSREQLKVARDRSAVEGLGRCVRFEFRDYREVKRSFDRIVSIGMFEHVGTGHYGRFFQSVNDALKDDGVALIHSIGSAGVPQPMNPWIRKYIFPGGYIPSLSEIVPEIEKAGLIVTDIEILRLHYAETLKRWQKRIQNNRDKVIALMGETFFRKWEFYLAVSEVAFRNRGLVVFQIQLARQQDAVPLTRDYVRGFETQILKQTDVAA